MSLSVVVNTKNAAATLDKALRSVRFADEIVVVDMKSTDRTVDIAKKYTTQVFVHPDVGYVEPARNFAISKAKSDWILVIDADEFVPDSLASHIQTITTTENTSDCYYLPRLNIIWGEPVKFAGWWPDYILRLFRKGRVTWSDQIHAIPITLGEVSEFPASEQLAIVHENYQTIEQFVNRMNHYTTIQAKNSLSHGKHNHDVGKITPAFTAEFLSRLFARNGIQGGVRGVSLSFLQGISDLLVSLKIWQGHAFKPDLLTPRQTIEQLESFDQELRYWIAGWRTHHSSGLTRLFWQLRRRLKL